MIHSKWPAVSFRDLLRRVERRLEVDDSEVYRIAGVRWYGKGAFIRDTRIGMSIARKRQWVIRDGDIVYNKLFAWKGAFAVAGPDVDGCIVSDKFPTYGCDHNRVDIRWLRWYFRTRDIAWQAEAMSKGAAAISKLTLNPPDFWQLTIPLPPIDEQEQVIGTVEELAARVAEAKGLRQLSTAGVEQLFGAALDQAVNNLSERHETRRLIDLVEPSRGISYGIVQTGQPTEYGVPTLRAGDLQKFQVVHDNVKRVDPDIEAKYRRTRLQGAELLLRIRGGLGELAICPNEMIGGNVSREIAVIPLKANVLPAYAMYLLSAPINQEKMMARLRGTSYVGINLKDVRDLAIPVPPIAEQQRIVAHFDDLRGKKGDIDCLSMESAEAVNSLLPSILNHAFRGEL